MKDECSAWSGAVVSYLHINVVKPRKRIEIENLKPCIVFSPVFVEKEIAIVAVHQKLRTERQRKIGGHGCKRKRNRAACRGRLAQFDGRIVEHPLKESPFGETRSGNRGTDGEAMHTSRPTRGIG